MTDDASLVRSRAAAVYDAGTLLRAARVEERAHWLSEATLRLAHHAHDRRRFLSDATGLSLPMVQWALQTTLGTVREETMVALVARARKESGGALDPIAMLSVVLAGNVFTAPVRGVLTPLLFGVPVLVKASSREGSFPEMLRDSLRLTDSRLGAAIDLVTFPGGDVEREAALADLAEKVAVYGGDETIAAMTARLGTHRILAHGHGVSIAYCGAGALADACVAETIARLSLDVCAYDQRGCLSPQVVYVEETADRSAVEFAERFAETGLGAMSRTLPRGPLPAGVGAAQAQWRGVAEVEGRLFTGDSYAVSIRSGPRIRWSPGYRNVTIVPVGSLEQALRAMEPMGPILKCIGADAASVGLIRAHLRQSSALSAFACPLGEMQTPPFDAPADGRPIWDGLTKP